MLYTVSILNFMDQYFFEDYTKLQAGGLGQGDDIKRPILRI